VEHDLAKLQWRGVALADEVADEEDNAFDVEEWLPMNLND
jgi:hypothetical protein